MILTPFQPFNPSSSLHSDGRARQTPDAQQAPARQDASAAGQQQGRDTGAAPSAVFIRSERYQMLERNLSVGQAPGTDAAGAAQQVQQPSAGAVKASDNILGFIDAQLRRDLADGASEEELASRLNAGLEGFIKGFTEASEQLQAMGFLSAEIAADIQQTYDRVLAGVEELRQEFAPGQSIASLENAPDSGLPAVSAEPAAAAESRYFASSQSSQENSFRFSLTTADGDKVSIDVSSLRTSLQQGILDSVLDYRERQTESERFSLSVEGELDEDELSAINDLLGQLNDLAGDFFAGDLEGALDEALSLGYDSSEISRFSLNLSQTSVQRVQQAYGGQQPESPNTGGLAQRLQPLGGFVQGLQEAFDTASRFGEPRTLIEDLSSRLEQSGSDSFRRSVSTLLDGLQAA